MTLAVRVKNRDLERPPGRLLDRLWPTLLTALVFTSGAAEAASPELSLSTRPKLSPHFAFSNRDYVVRCDEDPVAIEARAPGEWKVRVGTGPFHSGQLATRRSLAEGEEFVVTFRKRGGDSRRSFHTRCLPADFPALDFKRVAPGVQRLFIIQAGEYVAILNSSGTPLWWFHTGATAYDAKLLPDHTLAWAPVAAPTVSTGSFEIRSLRGELLRVVEGADGLEADVHELQLLPSGNYLLGTQLPQAHVDTTPYGGSSTDDTVIGAEIQEVTPAGELVWKWDSEDHIGLSETAARWWDVIHGAGFLHNDVVHFNAAEPAGEHLLLSFRHLDAVYKIDRDTGNIVWKLGGVETPDSLEVVDDPYDYPLGGQHDVRLQPDGSITMYDDRTGLAEPPRVVRYEIDETAGTASLVESFGDNYIAGSFCCGSARRFGSGRWLVNWGSPSYIGGYDANGRRLFRLQGFGFSYRADPIPGHTLSLGELRLAMNEMAG